MALLSLIDLRASYAVGNFAVCLAGDKGFSVVDRQTGDRLDYFAFADVHAGERLGFDGAQRRAIEAANDAATRDALRQLVAEAR